MAIAPNLESYSIEKLAALGDDGNKDAFFREEIKELIVNKILMLYKPLFSLVNKFKNSKGILHIAYAKVILMKLAEEDIESVENIILVNEVIDEIIAIVSLEDLCIYCDDIRYEEIKMKCKDRIMDYVMNYDTKKCEGRKTAMYCRRSLVKKLNRKPSRREIVYKMKGER